jgi:DNA-directed RNA polymerase specialized sigma24 family protein
VAHTLGLQANTASKLLQRVRERLRECIEPRHRREARA